MTYEEKSAIVIEQLRADRDRLVDAFDKIKAEIEVKLAEPQYQHEGEDWQNGLIMAEIIIDKYKVENEEYANEWIDYSR